MFVVLCVNLNLSGKSRNICFLKMFFILSRITIASGHIINIYNITDRLYNELYICPNNTDIIILLFQLILKHSMYHPFVKDWMEVFSKDQFIILRSEEFYHNHTDVTNRIFSFLGLGMYDPWGRN